MTPVGIFTALTSEARSVAGRDVEAGRITELAGGAMLLCGGVGAGRAEEAARLLVERGAKRLVSLGIAGGLDPTLRPGTVVVATAALAPDGAAFDADAGWRRSVIHELEAARIKFAETAITESAVVVASPEAKSALNQATGAGAVDMESAAVGRVAASAGLPFLVVRAVSDPAERSLPKAVLVTVDAEGRPRRRALVRTLLREPGLVPRILTLRRESKAALRALAEVRQAAAGALFLGARGALH